MSWESDLMSAERMLSSTQIPPLDKIIFLVKRINPTNLALSEADRHRGYEIKDRLQNLLLENYGEYFTLVTHPCNPAVVLIKHAILPTIDACHTCLESISTKALDAIGDLGVKQPEKAGTKGGKAKPKSPLELTPGSARAAVKKARQLLDIYEYEEAERTLASIRINGSDELPELVRAVRMFTEEIGAYDRTIETLLSQPKQVVNNKDIRELLALTYYNNSMTPEARAVFDSLSPADLGKAALYAWADIAYNDGTLSLACHLLRLADEKEGLTTARAGLKKDIEAGLLKEAEPALQRAVAAFQRLDFNEAALLTREVLSWYPGCQQARKLLGEIESTNTKEHINELWQRFNQAEGAEEKLGLLARLLELDREQKVWITSLIEVEKAGQKRKLFDKRMDELRELSAAKNWSACFATVTWLMDQEDQPERIQEIQSLSPYFSILYRNRRLQRLTDQSAEELWLAYLQLSESVRLGQTLGLLETAERVRPFFGFHPRFKEEYRLLLASEQDAARVLVAAVI